MDDPTLPPKSPKPPARFRQQPLARGERIHAHRNGRAVAFVASLSAEKNTDKARKKHGLGLRRVYRKKRPEDRPRFTDLLLRRVAKRKPRVRGQLTGLAALMDHVGS